MQFSRVDWPNLECFKKISKFYFTCELEDLVSKETVVSDVDGEVRCENNVLIALLQSNKWPILETSALEASHSDNLTLIILFDTKLS